MTRLDTKNSWTQNWTLFDNITLSLWLKLAPTITTINTCYKNSHMATNPSTCLSHMTGRQTDTLTSSSSLTLGFYSCGTWASINGSMRLTAGSPLPLALEVHALHPMMASPLFATPLMSLRLKTAWLSRRVHTSRHRGACYRTEPQYLRSDTFIQWLKKLIHKRSLFLWRQVVPQITKLNLWEFYSTKNTFLTTFVHDIRHLVLLGMGLI